MAKRLKDFIKAYSQKYCLQKASNWGNKIPVKKRTSDGRLITYWVSPEDLNQGKAKGQTNLFDDDEMSMDTVEPEDSYYSKIDSDIELYRVKPLLRQFEATEKQHPGLSTRIAKKYVDYIWGRDTRDLDIDLDSETAEFYKNVVNYPEYKNEYYQEYLENTQKTCKMLNNRKMQMARLKVGSKVKYQGQETKIKGVSDRGFPIVNIDGADKKVFVEEIIDLDYLIEKYGRTA